MNLLERTKHILHKLYLVCSRRAIILDKDRYSDMQMHWGQQAEDALIRVLLPYTTCGTYVDIGAYHPTRWSNTYSFYLDGWTGINIDPSVNAITRLDQKRPKDINLNVGVSSMKGILEYFQFDVEAYNTFDQNVAASCVRKDKALPPVSVQVERLDDILRTHLTDTNIDFMSIDVEGFELSVLQSNDFAVFRPRLIVMEIHGRLPVDHYIELEQVRYLSSVGYVFIGIIGCATFFLSNEEYRCYKSP